MNKYNLSFIKTTICITGYAALLYWVKRADELGFHVELSGDIDLETEIINIPDDMSILSDEEIIIESTQVVKYNAILDKVPMRLEIDDNKVKYIVYNNINRLTSAKKINDKIYVANLQTIMCLFLSYGILHKNTNALSLYKTAQSLLFWACANTNDAKDFLPTVETYGSSNLSESYLISREEELTGKKQTDLKNIPRDAYPDSNKKISDELYSFDPNKSAVYQFDGLAVNQSVSLPDASSESSSDSSSDSSLDLTGDDTDSSDSVT